jgi:ELWxxDGT repeat protein
MKSLQSLGGAAPAQPTLVGESFSDGPYEPNDLTTYSPVGTTLLCFNGASAYDGNELFCYDGTSLTQVTNLRRASSSARPRDFVVYDAGSGPELFFGAFGPDGKELYAYDGTSVRQVADISPGAAPGTGPRHRRLRDQRAGGDDHHALQHARPAGAHRVPRHAHAGRGADRAD